MSSIKSRPTKKQKRQRSHDRGLFDGVLFVNSPGFKVNRVLHKRNGNGSKYLPTGH